MEDNNKFVATQSLLQSATSVIIILPADPSPDLISAGLSLHLSLQATGKKSQIGCGSEVHVGDKILGAGEIADSIGSKNLVISFNYREDDLEKVDYDVRPDGKFYLLIKPKSGSPIPDVSNVKYSYSGASADLVITLGINSLEELGKIYADEKNFLDEAKILSLNISPRPASFTENIFHYSYTSFAELTTVLLEGIGLKPTSDAAKNLLSSIYTESKNLTSSRMTADTFSAISFLMRHGARLPNQTTHHLPRFSQPAFFEAPVEPAPIILSAPNDENIPLPQEESIPLPEEDQPVPQDWTKPKIFRASEN